MCFACTFANEPKSLMHKHLGESPHPTTQHNLNSSLFRQRTNTQRTHCSTLASQMLQDTLARMQEEGISLIPQEVRDFLKGFALLKLKLKTLLASEVCSSITSGCVA
ncbi:hypothetical protein KIL84_004856 [Mauremys mutica]|uniref:Uncharacterized protein n=1 Tax=Mauremys mutica TaxID=74926 RepID=A0A9D3XMK3_9SAUR|nr:hypothetical protein KIL84_004856 [Mauremys mutica]